MSNEAYAAGILDGEGSIGISNRSDRYSFHLCIQVSMKLPTKVPKWLHTTFGGCYGEYKQSRSAYGNGMIAKWSMHGTQAQNFLEKVLPYLKDKKVKAELALAFPISVRGVLANTNYQELVRDCMQNYRDEG